MKIQNVKGKIKQLADAIGKQYFGLRERLKSVSSELEGTKVVIKELADKSGEDIGKLRVIEGDEFVVGFQRRSSEKVDYDRLFKLQPDIKKQVMVMTPSDEKLEALVKDGKVSRRVLAKCIVTSKETVAVYVVEKKDFKREDEETELD